jgi:thiol-disulfide isomerase/thioredoxin
VGLAAVVIVGLVLVLSSGGSDEGVEASPISQYAFLNEDGTTGTLADYQGEPLVVNFFASWCPPCRAELPDFVAVHQASEGAVQFLGINHDFDETTWRSFVAETELSYPTVFQPDQEIWSELGLIATPATLFITPEGEVVDSFTGVLDQEALTALIRQNLNVEI